ncbi:hypothetical protein ALQ64_02860 [Pseudomonas cannabina]|nr:hypothetical protein ALQ64_02860 [Pseudomonas cannabina]SDR32828.1 hypothetical protein SAMN05216597_3658 [Pseudomonas cannabina]
MADTIRTLITGVDQLSPTLATIRNNVKGLETSLGTIEVGKAVTDNA